MQGHSQDLNRPLQDIAQNFDDEVIIITPKIFKYCAISLNIIHTGELCGILGLTAPLILISKKFQSKYIYTLNSALCVPIGRAAIKHLYLCV